MINCIDCGKELNTRNKDTLRCMDCYRKHMKVEDDFCIDCGVQINKYTKSVRCSSCNVKFQWITGVRKLLPHQISIYEDILTSDFLYQNYVIEKYTAKYIGEFIGCDKTVIYRFLKKSHIPIRSNSEAQQGHVMSEEQKEKYRIMFTGSGNPNWKNGMGNFPYSIAFTDKLKQEIRERDIFTCQCCDLREKDHIRGQKQVNLIVHHIDYNKENCKKNNLITVCNKCNTVANFDRDYWFAFYTYIMENYIKEK